MRLNPAQDITDDVAMTTTQQRIREILEAIGGNQAELGRLAGAAPAVVHQWMTGAIQGVTARYAFQLEVRTGFLAKWIMLGTGPKKRDKSIIQVAHLMESMSETDRERLLKIAEGWVTPSPEADRPATAINRTSKTKRRRA